MKKNKKIGLSLNKKVVSELRTNQINGGNNLTHGVTCNTEPFTCAPESLEAWPAPCWFG